MKRVKHRIKTAIQMQASNAVRHKVGHQQVDQHNPFQDAVMGRIRRPIRVHVLAQFREELGQPWWAQ